MAAAIMRNSPLFAVLVFSMSLLACSDGCEDEKVTDEPRPEVTYLQFGTYHYCAVDEAATVWCAGSNARGQLGDGSGEDRDELTAVTGLGEMKGLAVGLFDTTCAWNDGGDLYCWGSNEYGQLARDDIDNSAEPVLIDGLPPVVDVAPGGFHVCALTEIDEVYCWGRNDSGQTGAGARLGPVVDTPVSVEIPGRVSAVKSGGSHACALNESGELYCWGSNADGQLGVALDDVAAITLPEPVVFVPGEVVDVEVAFRHSCALVGQRRRLYCWGDNSQGQFGLDDLEPRHAPTEIPEIAYVEELAVGAGQTCARMEDGVYCAGEVLRPVERARQTGEGYFFRPSQALRLTEVMWSGGPAICGLTEDAQVACRGVQP